MSYERCHVCTAIVIVLSCFSILTFFCSHGLYQIYNPINTGNDVLVQTMCTVINSDVTVKTLTVCECINSNCTCNLTTSYQKINTYYFPLATSSSYSSSSSPTADQTQTQTQNTSHAEGKLTFDWTCDYPTNDTNQVTDCYYNKCVFGTQSGKHCDPGTVGDITFSLYYVSVNEVLLSVIYIIGLVIIAIALCLTCEYLLNSCFTITYKGVPTESVV